MPLWIKKIEMQPPYVQYTRLDKKDTISEASWSSSLPSKQAIMEHMQASCERHNIKPCKEMQTC